MIEVLAQNIRKDVIKAGFFCGQSAHFGGGLSIVDLLAVLYSGHLRYRTDDPLWADRDYFILSKGHGVLGFYATLKNVGLMSQECFDSFQQDGSALIAHPVRNPAIGIESSNGSLGQGLSFGAGLALAIQKKQTGRHVYVLCGDGECNEGSVWEAAMFSAQHKLDNLTVIVDLNGFQNDGATESVSCSGDMLEKWSAFGWHSVAVDGHNVGDISAAYDEARKRKNGPTAIIATTVKGKGISFMENNNDWHHNRLTETNYKLAIDELEAHSRAD